MLILIVPQKTQLCTEIDHITQNIKTACHKQIITLDNLVEVKHGRDLPIMKALLFSNVKLLYNDYNKCANFIGTFLMCSWSGLTPKDFLEITSADRDMHNLSITSKLISYKDCAEIWKDLSISGLKFPRMANLDAIRVPRIIPFWETLQDAIDNYYRDLYTKS